MRGRAERFNKPAMCFAFWVPFLLFAFLLTVCTFTVHYNTEAAYRAICVFFGCLVIFFGFLAFRAVRRKAEGQGEPTWYVFLAVTALLAYLLAYALGNSNYARNMKPYYDWMNLNVYPLVNPIETRGQQLMDMGRVTFTSDSRLLLPKSMGFRNQEIYCVAPIVSGNQSMNQWDLWAVGTNCCSGHTADFACGEFNNPMAHSGLRLMRDDQRPYFRLALEQAEAAYNIKSVHPVFMYWMQDPLAEINAYQDEGFKAHMLSIFVFFAWQLFLVVVATVIFAKMGHM